MYQDKPLSKFQNLYNNLTQKQKIGIVAIFFVIVIILVIVGIAVSTQQSENKDQLLDDSSEYIEDEDYDPDYVDPEKTPIEGGDQSSIETFLPHAVFVEEEDFSALRYYIEEDAESDNVINVMFSACDEATSKTLAQEYLDSIPLDLSGYTINYEPVEEDAYCP